MEDIYTKEEREAFGCPKPPPRAKKEPKPLRRTPLKNKGWNPPEKKKYVWENKKNYQIPRRSKRAVEKADRVALAKIQKLNDTPLFCESCGLTGTRLTPSHILPQSEYPELAGDIENIHWHCDYPCHDNCEKYHFWLMADGLQCLEYIWLNERENEGARKRRFWNAIQKHPQNYDLWQLSKYYDPEIHVI